MNGGILFQKGQDRLVARDPERLLEQLRNDPGSIAWVAIPPELSGGTHLAERVREADPAVSVVLLGSRSASSDQSSEMIRSADTERTLHEAERRAQKAEKLASLTTLTARIAHDIGTPMTAILGYAELLAKSAESEKNQRRANTIVEQVRRVSDRIATLMNLTQSEDRAPIPLTLSGVVDQALDFFREKIERYGIDVERDDGPAPRVMGDPGRLRLALLHLLFRAVEAMPEGGTLRLALAEAESGDAELRIVDSGPAIDPDQQTTLLRPGGPAIGLVVAKTLAEEHGGSLSFESGPVRGSEFLLRLPKLETRIRD